MKKYKEWESSGKLKCEGGYQAPEKGCRMILDIDFYVDIFATYKSSFF